MVLFIDVGSDVINVKHIVKVCKIDDNTWEILLSTGDRITCDINIFQRLGQYIY